MPDERYFPAIPNDEVEDWKDDVRSGIVEGKSGKKSANPVDDALAEELKGFVPEDWAAKTHIRDNELIGHLHEVMLKIDVHRRYGNNEWADFLEEQVKKKLKLLVSVDGEMHKGMIRVFESFGAGGRGPGDGDGSGALMWLKNDLSDDDECGGRSW